VTANSLRGFLDEIEALRKVISKSKSKQIRAKPLKTALQSLVDTYFDLIRPSVLPAGAQDDRFRGVDEAFQELLTMSHKQVTTVIVANHLANVRKMLIGVDVETSARSVERVDIALPAVDQRIIDTLTSVAPAAALSYHQATLDLQQMSRYSWRGPACDLREALRESLDHLAPDSDVTSQPGYRAEANTHGPTMKQKVRFILKARRLTSAQMAPSETAVQSVDDAVGSFVRSVYTGSSGAAHTPSDRDEVMRVRDWVRVALCHLLAITS
jgi:hypothetical protein